MSRCIATAYKNLRVKMAASLWIGLSLDEYFFDLNSLAHTWRTERLHYATLASRTNYD